MKLGVAPKELGWFERFRLRLISTPEWMKGHGYGGFDAFMTSQYELKKHGIVVPGVFVQANAVLFEEGKTDHPAALLFTLSPSVDLLELRQTAHRLFDLKGEEFSDNEKRFFSRHLADEYEIVQGVKLSNNLSIIPDTYLSATIVYRAHLPDGYLVPSVYPVLVSPRTFAAMILPVQLWTDEGFRVYEEMMDVWEEDGEDEYGDESY